MKKLFTCLIFVLGTFFNVMSQSGFEAQNLALDIKHKPGEVIVKFKDEIHLKFTKSNNLVITGLAGVDKAFEKWSVSSSDQLFRNARYERNAGTIRFPDGTERPVPQFHNIFLLKYPEKFDPEMLAKELSKIEEVEYAEANATAFIHGLIPVSEPFSPDQLEAILNNRGSNGFVPNDPLFDQQWYLPAVKADIMWETITGNDTEVIAILDTGVDWTHPDLMNKIWQNPNETMNSQDTDGNGFVDDIRGWDFVNNDNNPMDDNSHGTHCAGIAAAETNNGIGISGVSWGAKIMPVKVFQSNGIGYFSDIAEGFWYAAQNGATIFSNSWSSSGESISIRLAMEFAYSKGLIVAAAGNQNHKTDFPFPPWPPTVPNFPACYNWVLGVEATLPGGSNTWFSNFDPTGPVISDGRPYGSIFFNHSDFNYEMRAPGLSFMSTIPGGQYRNYSGTSMATPLVAGAIALMKSYNPDLSNEMVFAKLIQPVKLGIMQAGVLDILTSSFTNPPPDLYYASHIITDTLNGGDRDGRPDAGEMIELYVTVKNAGGQANNVQAKLRFSEFEDQSTADIIKDTCDLGSISAYGTNTSFNSIIIKIDSNVVHFRIISFELLLWSEDHPNDTIFQSLTLTIENGIEIKGNYSKLHLTGDAFYVITDVSVIDSLIIDPGVTLTFNPSMFIAVLSYIRAVGKPDSLITFTGVTDGYYWNSIVLKESTNSIFQYCLFEYGGNSGSLITNPKIIENCIFNYCKNKLFSSLSGDLVFRYNVLQNQTGYAIDGAIFVGDCVNSDVSYNVIAENVCDAQHTSSMIGSYMRCNSDTLESVRNNVLINNKPYNFWLGTDALAFKYLPENYFGSSNLQYINSTILDFYELGEWPALHIVLLNGILASPPPECHGVVWKVLVNDQDPQIDNLEPIGAGPVKFDVYFNRPMDIAFDPFVTFGVRFPYTQNHVADSASWSADSTIWTAYHTMSLSSGDGINTVRVAHAKDTDHFEIPIERSRFKFVIQVAGSQSIDFLATPGIGKVTLEWPKSEETDILGYNFYRFQMEDGIAAGDTLLLNDHLVTDTTFIDFAVIPDETYYFMFTQMKTDFTESDFSKVVSATPFNAATGDANGDYVVNILDIITVVSYIMNENPQPFLLGAADVNNDGQINLLDIIGVVNIVMNKSSKSLVYSKPAYIFLEENEITLHSDGTLAGLQFHLIGNKLSELSFKNLPQGFEFARQTSGDTLSGVIYSLGNRTLPEGKIKLFDLTGTATDISWGAVFGGNYAGAHVPVYTEMNDSPVADIYTFKMFPNPAKELITIDLNVPEHSTVKLIVTDLSGREIYLSPIKVIENGRYRQSFHKKELNIGSGVFIFKTEVQPADKSIQPFIKETRLVVI